MTSVDAALRSGRRFESGLGSESIIYNIIFSFIFWHRRGRDHIVVGFTTTCAISAYDH